MAKERVLIVDDEPAVRKVLTRVVERIGLKAETAARGREALALLSYGKTFDLVLLDVMLGGMDGFAVVQQLREKKNEIPIMILSARSEEDNTLYGLELGADDYIAKPFNPVEIVARVKAQLRRASRSDSDVLKVGELTLDTASFQLTKGDKQILLTPMEYKILAILMRSPGRIFTKVQLYEGAVGNYFESDDNTMMVHISKLREKIEDDPKAPRHIITVRGLGYKLEK